MQKSILFFLLIPVWLSGQDCGSLIRSNVDQISGEVSYQMIDPIVVAKSESEGVIIQLFSIDGVVVWNMKLVGAGNCVDEGSEIEIRLSDDRVMKLAHMGDFNCDQNSTVYFDRRFKNLKLLDILQDTEVQIIRAWTYDNKYVQESLSPEQSMRFKTALGCLR